MGDITDICRCQKESESSIKDEIIKYLYWTQRNASYVFIDASVFQRGSSNIRLLSLFSWHVG